MQTLAQLPTAAPGLRPRRAQTARTSIVRRGNPLIGEVHRQDSESKLPAVLQWLTSLAV